MVLEHRHLFWMCIWLHLHTHTVTNTDISPDLGELAEIPRQCVSVQITPLQYGQGCRTFQTASCEIYSLRFFI